MRVSYYAVFSRYTDQLQALRLVGGHYESAEVTEVGLPIPELELTLGLWRGNYQNIDRLWLRWLTAEGNLILTPSEQATEVEQQLALAQQQAREAEQRAERLAARLRELGIDPEQLA